MINLIQDLLAKAIIAMFHAFEILAHVLVAPGIVSRDLSDVVPIAVVRIDHDLSIVGRAAAQSSCSGIEHSVDLFAIRFFAILGGSLLLFLVRVMTDEEVPFHRIVFGSERMEDWNIVVIG